MKDINGVFYKMKLYILTLPLGFNYGGVLQNYALQTALQSLGYETKTVQFRVPMKILFLTFVKRCIVRILRLLGINKFKVSYSNEERKYIWQKVLAFVYDQIELTQPVTCTSKLKKIIAADDIAGFVIGSDQVWRPKYTLDISWYFCDFLPIDSKCKRIAYSASFGVDCNEYSAKQIQMVKKNIGAFTAISVRENSGIKLAEEIFGCSGVVCTLDPTLLLTSDEYKKLLSKTDFSISREVVTYFLNASSEKTEISQQTANSKNCTVVNLLNDNYEYNNGAAMPVVPSIEEWLAHISNAECVLTDSFHGMVFSILFHRQFVVFCNPQRGNARIENLLKVLGLQDRMIQDTSWQTVEKAFNSEICYDQVDRKLQEYRDFSFAFLQNSLQKK